MTKITKAEFDALPESLKAKFKAEGDAYSLIEEDVTGLKKNKQELLDELKSLKEKYGDIDPDAAKTALAEARKAEEEALEKKGEFETLRKQLEERHNTELEKVKGENARILSNLKLERLTNVLTEKGVLPDRAKYLVHEMDSQVELVSDDSGFSLKKIGGIGDATEFDALIDGVKTSSPFFFAPNNASGSGASGSQAGTAGVDLSKMSTMELLNQANATATVK